jgi:translation initiation factor RLI1
MFNLPPPPPFPSFPTGKLCIEAGPSSKMAWISEELCIGCGICVKVRGKGERGGD